MMIGEEDGSLGGDAWWETARPREGEFSAGMTGAFLFLGRPTPGKYLLAHEILMASDWPP